MAKHQTIDRGKKFNERYGKLFKAFMEVEAQAFNGDKERKFIIEEISKKVKRFILDNCFNYVEIKTLTKGRYGEPYVGLASCSLTLDMSAHGGIDTNIYGRDVTIILCTCGTNFSAQDKDQKSIYASECYEEYNKWCKSQEMEVNEKWENK